MSFVRKVDPVRFVAELDHDVRIEEVLGAQAEACKAELIEHRDEPGGVVGGDLDPDVEIFGVAGCPMNCDGEPAHDQVADPVTVQELQQIAEVLAKSNHDSSYHRGGTAVVGAWVVLARALGSTGDNAGALDAATRGLALVPRDPDLLRSQATALAGLHRGEADAALAAYDRFRSPDSSAELRIHCASESSRCAREREQGHTHLLHPTGAPAHKAR